MISNSLSVTIEGTASSLHKNEDGFFTKAALKCLDLISFVPNFAVKHVVVPKVNKLARFHADTCLKFQYLTKSVENSDDPCMMDEDLVIRDMLEDIKKSLSVAVKSFEDIQKKANKKSDLFRCFFTLNNVLKETYTAATQLQWAIAEHDADISTHLEGFTASSAKEAEDILNKIFAAA
jgi:hypothetical protein